MPTAEDLERVQALIKRLHAIGAAAPGVIITADAWNVLVDSVVEIARSLVELGSGEVPPHDHLDQVGLAWLDARVRALVESGPLVEPAAQARLQDLEHARTRLDSRLVALDTTLGSLRTETREVKTRDLEREQSVNVVRRKIESVSDGRDDVSALRTTLDSLTGRVDEAVRLGRLLDGVDVRGLSERVESIEKLREQLRFPSGEDFDAAVLDQRFAGLRAEMVSEEELREAIEDIRRKNEGDIKGVADRLTASVDTRFDDREKALEDRLEGLADSRIDKLRELLPALVSDAVSPVEDRVRQQAVKDASDAIKDAVAGVEGRLDSRFDAFGDTLRKETGAAVDGLRGTLDARVNERLDAQLTQRLSAMDSRLRRLEGRGPLIEGQLTALDARDLGLETRIDDVAKTQQADAGALRQQIGAAAGDAKAAREATDKLDGTFDERAAGVAKSTINLEVQRSVDDHVAGLEDKLTSRVGTSLRKELNDIVDRRIKP